MANAVVTAAADPIRKQPRPDRGRFEAHGLSEEEARVRAIAEIVGSMVDLSRPRGSATASRIVVAAVMSKPHRCPHIATTGNICVYCPGGPDSDFEYSTQSYIEQYVRAKNF
ncbi:hypothetical protein ACLB2K_041961 [Fragaria x ananassa]